MRIVNGPNNLEMVIMPRVKWAGIILACILGVSSVHAATAVDYVNYGDLLVGKKDYKEAIKYYGYAAKLDQKMWQAYRGLAVCHENLGDYSQAMGFVDQALSINPNDENMKQMKTQLQQKSGAAVAPAVGQTSAVGKTKGREKTAAVGENMGKRGGSRWKKVFKIAGYTGGEIAGTAFIIGGVGNKRDAEGFYKQYLETRNEGLAVDFYQSHKESVSAANMDFAIGYSILGVTTTLMALDIFVFKGKKKAKVVLVRGDVPALAMKYDF